MPKVALAALALLASALVLPLPAALADGHCSVALVPVDLKPPPFTKNSLHPIRFEFLAAGGQCAPVGFEMQLDGVAVPGTLTTSPGTFVAFYQTTANFAIGPHTVRVVIDEGCCDAQGNERVTTFLYVFHLN